MASSVTSRDKVYIQNVTESHVNESTIINTTHRPPSKMFSPSKVHKTSHQEIMVPYTIEEEGI